MDLKRVAAVIVLLMGFLAVGAQIRAQDDPDDSTQRVTGCVKKPPSSNVYLLLDENGKLWELQSKNISFAAHVGHTVTVSGSIPQKSKEKDPSQDTAPQNRLNVTKLDMIRDSCNP
jgi:hypothetical protein